MESSIHTKVNRLNIHIYPHREEMGVAAGKAIARAIAQLLSQQETVTVIFAAAPSQTEMLQSLSFEQLIDWNRVIAFHLDEYVGLPEYAPQSFRSYLNHTLFDGVKPLQVHYLQSETSDSAQEAERYERLLREYPIDIACIGIGENGHIAFNDPHNSDFDDKYLVKVVELADESRKQQINDGLFQSMDEVPTHAISVTLPVIMNSHQVFCVVPGGQKAKAVQETLFGPFSTDCPASILRQHKQASLYLDLPASSRILKEVNIE